MYCCSQKKVNGCFVPDSSSLGYTVFLKAYSVYNVYFISHLYFIQTNTCYLILWDPSDKSDKDK